MIDLLRYLEANGFSNYIASGGGRNFMRPISQEVYGIPRERVIGSSTALAYSRMGLAARSSASRNSTTSTRPGQACAIWSRIGRRPLLAAGNSNGDISMLQFTHHVEIPSMRLLIRHDDPEREFAYTSGAEKALQQADTNGWTIVSMKNDWTTVF